MQKPICRKCGGDLSHEIEGEIWICKSCGCKYRYIPRTSREQERINIGIHELSAQKESITYEVCKITDLLQPIEVIGDIFECYERFAPDDVGLM